MRQEKHINYNNIENIMVVESHWRGTSACLCGEHDCPHCRGYWDEEEDEEYESARDEYWDHKMDEKRIEAAFEEPEDDLPF